MSVRACLRVCEPTSTYDCHPDRPGCPGCPGRPGRPSCPSRPTILGVLGVLASSTGINTSLDSSEIERVFISRFKFISHTTRA
jgi:hypothetical protein